MRAVAPEPFPSKGEGWVGVRASSLKRMALEAAPPQERFHTRPALTPIPALPPSRGKGSAGKPP
jgi:hypothetical protein